MHNIFVKKSQIYKAYKFGRYNRSFYFFPTLFVNIAQRVLPLILDLKNSFRKFNI